MNVTINGLRYNVETSGTGEWQALFLHYFAGRGTTWHETMQRVPTIRCYAPDLAGFGATSTPEAAYTVDQHAADLVELVTQLELDNFALVGHSMGGKIAMALAALQPTGLRELILIAPSPPTPEPMSEQARQKLVAAYGDRAAIERHINEVVGNPLPANLLHQAVDENLHASAPAWRGWLEKGSREDISDRIGQITVPVTIIGGERDTAIPPEVNTTEITPRLAATSARVSVLPGIGHLIPYEHPQAIADALSDARR